MSETASPTDADAFEEQSTARGIPCPKCRSPLSDVVRTIRGVDKMRRRRRCVRCNTVWVTKEETEMAAE